MNEPLNTYQSDFDNYQSAPTHMLQIAHHDFRLERRDVLVDEGELWLDGRDVGHEFDDRGVEVSGQLDVGLDGQHRARQTGGKFKFKIV